MKISDYADSNQLSLYKKFPSTHYLSNPKNVLNTLAWITFFRKNIHRLAIDYLGISLYPYQALVLYLMGIGNFTNIIGSRSIAKSFLIALYACCKAILYPNSQIVVASATVGQAELIISKKIQDELMNASPQLRKEIADIKRVNGKLKVFFHNGSTIVVVPALDSARGERSTLLIREENRMIDKKIDDSVLSPFQVTRFTPYIKLSPYDKMPELKEEPEDVYITSSWLDDGHWMWNIADTAFKDMLNHGTSYLLAFDESVVLKHGIKTKKQLERERKKLDSLSWRIEYLNERVKENTSAFFNYQELARQQKILRPFYPRKLIDVLSHKKNLYELPKQSGEIRIVSCDMAFIQGDKNDNSIFSCIRLLPESTTHTLSDKSVETNNGYRRQIPYIESIQGGDTDKQALRIRQLFEDFKADYIVLDLRNAGISVYDKLAKVMYDDERNIEYSPLSCMNNDDVANRIKVPNANPCIFVIVASQKLNSEIAMKFKTTLQDNKIDLLIPFNKALEDQLPKMEEYQQAVLSGMEEQLFYEKPYIETQEFINETNNLICERKDQTGIIVISEKGNNRKDRYTSVSYGNYFASLLEQDLLSDNSDYETCVFIN